MIKFQATAIIHDISPVIDIPSKNGGQGFQKRELILDDSWTKDGNTYPNFILIEFSGDKMSQLDNFMPGQRVTVDVYVSGREYQGRYFNTIRGISVALFQPQPQQGQASQYPASVPSSGPGYPQQPPAPMPGYAQHPAYPQQYPQQPAYPQQPTYPNQGGYANGYSQQAPQAPMPAPPQGGNLGPEDLPFR